MFKKTCRVPTRVASPGRRSAEFRGRPPLPRQRRDQVKVIRRPDAPSARWKPCAGGRTPIWRAHRPLRQGISGWIHHVHARRAPPAPFAPLCTELPRRPGRGPPTPLSLSQVPTTRKVGVSTTRADPWMCHCSMPPVTRRQCRFGAAAAPPDPRAVEQRRALPRGPPPLANRNGWPAVGGSGPSDATVRARRSVPSSPAQW